MNSATISIENNPQTGANRPFELYFTTERGGKQFSGSFTTMENAQAKAKKLAKLNSEFYAVTLLA